jgi:hypothetical protein
MNMAVPDDAGPYQARVRQSQELVSLRFGDWVGEDIPVPTAAITLLHPNVMISRRYTNIKTGRSASLLLDQCSDVRDMNGHFPPICYPNQGWTLEKSIPRQWVVDGLTISGMEYHFSRGGADNSTGVVVRNFMILPGGTIAADMDAIRRNVDLNHRFYGAGQIQVITDRGIPYEDQEQIFRSLVAGHEPVIKAILAPVK